MFLFSFTKLFCLLLSLYIDISFVFRKVV